MKFRKKRSGILEADYQASERLGLRWQSAATTPLLGGRKFLETKLTFRACESGVALRFPPQSKTRWCKAEFRNNT